MYTSSYAAVLSHRRNLHDHRRSLRTDYRNMQLSERLQVSQAQLREEMASRCEWHCSVDVTIVVYENQ